MFQALEVGPFLIWSRVLFLLLGIWLSTEFLLRLAESANLSIQHFREKALWYVLAFVVGGRLFSVIAEYQVYLKDPLRVFILWDGNFTFLGGAIGIGTVLYLLTREHRSIFLQWLDVLFPATCLGLTFDWVGSFLSGASYGQPTDLIWGVTYDAPDVRYTIPIHPVQLYYAFSFFLLTFILLVIRKRAKRVGAETLVGIIAASLLTFFFEFFRGDFAIPVYAATLDFFVLAFLFLSLGIFAVVEQRMIRKTWLTYQVIVASLTLGYVLVRPWLELETHELRLSQLLAVLALLATTVYVAVERRRHPYF